jgi:hypothetical protein
MPYLYQYWYFTLGFSRCVRSKCCDRGCTGRCGCDFDGTLRVLWGMHYDGRDGNLGLVPLRRLVYRHFDVSCHHSILIVGTTDVTGIGIEMERLAAQMGGTVKFAYNESECLDADYFKLVADHLVIATRTILLSSSS